MYLQYFSVQNTLLLTLRFDTNFDITRCYHGKIVTPEEEPSSLQEAHLVA